MYTNKYAKEQGITLIALAVTIVVLLILAGVSLSAVFGQNGIIGKAQEAQNKMDNAENSDLTAINNLNQEVENWINGTIKNVISKEESYVGYFADVDGDGTVDGVIYADLVIGETGLWYDDGYGANSNGAYSYEAVEDKSTLKNYVISQESYTVEGALGYETKPVLKAVGSGNERFYVMALNDVTNTGTTYDCFTWYDAAYEGNDGMGIMEYNNITSVKFGEGKNNTSKMIELWNKEEYGAQDDRKEEGYLDIWGVIQDENKNGWFVPSKEEWNVFAKSLKINSSNYEDYKLRGRYWASSIYNRIFAWGIDFSFVDVTGWVFNEATGGIRLSICF